MDRTRQAVERQLEAMACERYEIGVMSRAPSKQEIVARLQGSEKPLRNDFAETLVRQQQRDGRVDGLPPPELEGLAQGISNKSNCMQLFSKSKQQILDDVPWLRRQNARGMEVYIRPEGHQGLILVDDIPPSTVADMRRNGCTPAAVLETSKDNCQAWVRVSGKPLTAEVSTEVAKDLATRFDADQHSAKQRQFGRLAGFTNQKPSRTIAEGPYAGLQPFVLLREASGRPAPAGPELVRAAEQRVQSQERERAELAREEARQQAAGGGQTGQRREPTRDVQVRGSEHYQRLSSNPTFSADLSRLDFAVAKDLTKDGYGREQVIQAIAQLSPRLEERHDPADYVPRTVDRARESVQRDALRASLASHAGEQGREEDADAPGERSSTSWAPAVGEIAETIIAGGTRG